MKQRNGQAMLIAVLTLGGAILGATSIAGILILYQIRSTTDSADSAKAIFAADSGLNWALYTYFEGGSLMSLPQPTLGNGATVSTTCYAIDGTTEPCDNSGPASTTSATAEGFSNGARREFLVDLVDATQTLP